MILKVIFCDFYRGIIRGKFSIRFYYNNIIWLCYIISIAKSKDTISVYCYSRWLIIIIKKWVFYNYFIKIIIKRININTVLKSSYYFFITWIFINTFIRCFIEHFTIRRLYIIYIFKYYWFIYLVRSTFSKYL